MEINRCVCGVYTNLGFSCSKCEQRKDNLYDCYYLEDEPIDWGDSQKDEEENEEELE